MSYYSGNSRRGQSGNYGGRNQRDSRPKYDSQGPRKFNQRSKFGGRNGPDSQNSSQVWMGDLDAEWGEAEIMSFWSRTGMNPIGVKIMRDRYNESARPMFCFVTFSSPEEAASALQKNGTSIPGSDRKFKLSHAGGAQGNDNQKKKFDDFSIFVGDLDPELKEPQLFDIFNAKYSNSVRQVKIMTDPTSNVSKGFGFVRFTSAVTQQTALRDKEIMYRGKVIKIGVTANGAGSASSDATSNNYESVQLAQHQPPMNHNTDPSNTWIRIQGIAARFSKQELISHFSSFGTVVSCILDADFNQCYIRYLLRSQAERAIVLMSNVIINGCVLSVNWSEPKNDGVHKTKINPDKSIAEIPSYYGKGIPSIEGFTEAHVSNELRDNVYEESEPNLLAFDKQYVSQELEALRSII